MLSYFQHNAAPDQTDDNLLNDQKLQKVDRKITIPYNLTTFSEQTNQKTHSDIYGQSLTLHKEPSQKHLIS